MSGDLWVCRRISQYMFWAKCVRKLLVSMHKGKKLLLVLHARCIYCRHDS